MSLSPSRQAAPGSVDRIIADDHAFVERLFQHLEAQRGDRRVLANQVSFQLALHATAEEQVVYPAVADASGKDAATQARAEHQDMKEQLVILDSHDPGSPDFEQALARIIADVREHAPHEETEWLPEVRSQLGDEAMLELGEKFNAVKRKAPQHAHPHAPSTPVAEKLAGLPAAMVDKVRDRASGRRDTYATDASGLLDPELQRVVDALGGLDLTPPQVLTPKQARKGPTLRDAVLAVLTEDKAGTDPEPAAVSEHTVPGPGGDIAVRLYRPSGAADGDPLPLVVYFHGGGWVLYDIDTYDASCRALANASGAAVASVEYRHAPEHPFPAAHDDALAATRWLVEHGGELGLDPARFAVAGESAGGNLAAYVGIALRDAGDPVQPAFQLLIYPVTSASNDWPSFDDAADAIPLNPGLLGWMVQHTTSGETAPDWRLDLLSLERDQLAALPPALVILAERDPLRDQGTAFARALEDAGVPVTAELYPGTMHEFFGTAAVSEKARKAVAAAGDGLRGAFAGQR